MSLKIYFLRHGQTDLNRDDLYFGSSSDVGLSQTGIQMAQCFADTYKSFDWKAVYCSPLKRAIMTANPLCQARGVKAELRDGLKEIDYGLWDGQSKEFVNQNHHQDHVNWNSDPFRYAPTQGETALMIAQRALPVIDEVKQNFDSGNVLVISHKTTIRIILCSLLGIDLSHFRIRLGCPIASLSIVELVSQGPLLLRHGDQSHLSEELRKIPST
jgi:broad specificity phosphatase PhoE